MKYNKEKLFNVSLDVLDNPEAIHRCNELLESEKCNSLFFINAHCFNIAQKNKKYLKALNTSEILLNDGIGIKIASKLSNIKLKANLNGTDFIPKLIDLANDKEYKIYLLGGKEGITNKVEKIIKEKYINIQIAGSHSGYFTVEEEIEIINEINSKKVDLLIVGMGVPIQEMWIEKNRNKLNTVKLCVAGGAIFDFISGNVNRAPQWMQKKGLEWFYRLILEPKRMWKRYLIGNIKFFFHLIILKFFKKTIFNV